MIDPALENSTKEPDEIREAFNEGFALSKLGGSIEAAWERSEARQTAAIAALSAERAWQPKEKAEEEGGANGHEG